MLPGFARRSSLGVSARRHTNFFMVCLILLIYWNEMTASGLPKLYSTFLRIAALHVVRCQLDCLRDGRERQKMRHNVCVGDADPLLAERPLTGERSSHVSS
jgi:hypothetical protein